MTITDDELAQLLVQCHSPRLPQPLELRTDQENRRERRWQVFDMYATIYHQGREYCIPVNDLSLSGLRLAFIPPEFSVGHHLIIVLPLGHHGTLAIVAEVVHCSLHETGRQAGAQFRLQESEQLLPLVSFMTQLWCEAQEKQGKEGIPDTNAP